MFPEQKYNYGSNPYGSCSIKYGSGSGSSGSNSLNTNNQDNSSGSAGSNSLNAGSAGSTGSIIQEARYQNTGSGSLGSGSAGSTSSNSYGSSIYANSYKKIQIEQAGINLTTSAKYFVVTSDSLSLYGLNQTVIKEDFPNKNITNLSDLAKAINEAEINAKEVQDAENRKSISDAKAGEINKRLSEYGQEKQDYFWSVSDVQNIFSKFNSGQIDEETFNKEIDFRADNYEHYLKSSIPNVQEEINNDKSGTNDVTPDIQDVDNGGTEEITAGTTHKFTYDDDGRIVLDVELTDGVETKRTEYEYETDNKGLTTVKETVYEQINGNSRRTNVIVTYNGLETSRSEYQYDDNGKEIGNIQKTSYIDKDGDKHTTIINLKVAGNKEYILSTINLINDEETNRVENHYNETNEKTGSTEMSITKEQRGNDIVTVKKVTERQNICGILQPVTVTVLKNGTETGKSEYKYDANGEYLSHTNIQTEINKNGNEFTTICEYKPINGISCLTTYVYMKDGKEITKIESTFDEEGNEISYTTTSTTFDKDGNEIVTVTTHNADGQIIPNEPSGSREVNEGIDEEAQNTTGSEVNNPAFQNNCREFDYGMWDDEEEEVPAANTSDNNKPSVSDISFSKLQFESSGIDVKQASKYIIVISDYLYKFNTETIMQDFPGVAVNNLNDLKQAIEAKNAVQTVPAETAVSESAPLISDEEVELYVELLKDVIPDIDTQAVKAMIKELQNAAESKGVDATEYVSARLVDFLQMRAENPNLSLEEMNEQLALNDVLNLSFYSLVPTVSELFSTDITSFEELLEFQDWERMLMDEYPQAKQAYVQTSWISYLSLAQTGDLTKGKYYELLKADLLNIYPDVDDLDDYEITKLSETIDRLTPEQVIEFINKALTLPAIYDEDYQILSDDFKYELNKVAQSSTFTGINNLDETIDLKSVYKDATGIKFNPDGIIDTNTKLEKLQDAINENVTYQTALNIFSAAENGEKDEGSALWQIGVLYTGSTESDVIEAFLRDISDNESLYIEDNKVIIPAVAGARGMAPSDDNGSVMDNVKDWCKSAWHGFVDLIESESVQEIEANADFTSVEGWCNYLGELLTCGDFYKDTANLGMLFAGGAELKAAATAGTAALDVAMYELKNAGIGLTEMIFGASFTSGAVLDYLQNPDVSYDGITNFIAELMEGGTTIMGGKYINAAFEIPSALKGFWNSVTSEFSTMSNKITDFISNFTKNKKKVFSYNDQERFMYFREAIENGKFFDIKPHLDEIATKRMLERRTKYGNLKVEIEGIYRDINKNLQSVFKSSLDKAQGISKSEYDAIMFRKGDGNYNRMYQLYSEGNLPEEELYQEILNNLKKFDEWYVNLIAAKNGKTYEERLNYLAKKELNKLKNDYNNIAILKSLTETNTNSAPLKLFRTEYSEMLTHIKIGDQTLDEIYKNLCSASELERTQLLKQINDLLQQGNCSYTFERMAGTTLLEGQGWGTAKLNWILDAEQNASQGMFLDIFCNRHDYEWEWLMAEGTNANLNKLRLNVLDNGDLNLIIEGEIKATTKSGQNITKKIAIMLGVISTGATAANAQSNPPSQPEPQIESQPEIPETSVESTPDLPYKPDDADGASDDNNPYNKNEDNPTPTAPDNSQGDQVTGGNTGANGSSNTNGSSGSNNSDGNNGAIGTNGASGINGSTGTDGTNGSNGAGKSSGSDDSPGLNPEWDSVYGDLGGGSLDIPSVEYTLGQGSVNYSGFINGNNYTSVESIRNVWPGMSKEERESWLINYAQQLLQERYGDIEGVNFDISIDSSGNLNWKVTSTSESLDTVQIEQWLNDVKNDSSRDLASLNGASGYGYVSENTINNKLKNGAYINSEGNFDIDRFAKECKDAGVNIKMDYVSFTESDGSIVCQTTITSGDGISITYEKIIDSKGNVISNGEVNEDYESLELKELEFLDYIAMRKNQVSYGLNADESALNARMQSICNEINAEFMQKYIEEYVDKYLNGHFIAGELLEQFGGISETFGSYDETRTVLKFDSNKIASYITDKAWEDEKSGNYNWMQTWLRTQDRLEAFNRIQNTELTGEQIQNEYDRLINDECASEYAWLASDFGLPSAQDRILDNTDIDTTQPDVSHFGDSHVVEVLSLDEYLQRAVANGINEIYDALAVFSDYRNCTVRVLKDENLNDYIYIEGTNQYGEECSFRYYLDPDVQAKYEKQTNNKDDKDFFNNCYQKGILAYLNKYATIVRTANDIKAEIRLAELEVYEKMTLYSRGEITLEEYKAALDNYYRLQQEYMAKDEQHAYYVWYVYSNDANTPNHYEYRTSNGGYNFI